MSEVEVVTVREVAEEHDLVLPASQWECVYDETRGVSHVMPINDLRPHQDDENCWCRPKLDEKTGSIYFHQSLDQREEYESGRLLIH